MNIPDPNSPDYHCRLFLASLGNETPNSGALRRKIETVYQEPPGYDWGCLLEALEYHGLAALLGPALIDFLEGSPGTPKATAKRVIQVLVHRQRNFYALRERSIDDLLTELHKQQLSCILLKGSALAHLVYPDAALRPMVDIDILVDPADVSKVKETVVSLGWEFERKYVSRFSGRMHHLPEAHRRVDGVRLALEIHTDALSPDQPYGMSIISMERPFQLVKRHGTIDGWTLAHFDMLRQLCRHAFVQARYIRLIHLYDIWRYQAAFQNEIDWERLRQISPDTWNILNLVAHVFSDANEPAGPFAAGKGQCPTGSGCGMLPMHDILGPQLTVPEKLRALFSPPDWWLHGFYGVPTDRSLVRCKLLIHPAALAKWTLRRVAAATGLLR